MSKSIGDGLEQIAIAIFLISLLWFVYKVGSGFVHNMNDYSPTEARCISVSGTYGGGKCYVNGEEK